jgi:RecG-like helicase
LAGVGPETAAKLAEIGVETPEHLLAYCRARTAIGACRKPIATLREGEAIVVGESLRVKERRGRFPLVTVDAADETGIDRGEMVRPALSLRPLRPATGCSSRPRDARRAAARDQRHRAPRVARRRALRGEIVPVYGATKELPSRTIRAVIAKNLDRLIAAHRRAAAGARARFGFPPLRKPGASVHAPRDLERRTRAQSRIVFEEFFGIALAAGAQARAPRSGRRRARDRAPLPGWYGTRSRRSCRSYRPRAQRA